MATPSKPAPAKQVAIEILRDAGKPLHAKEIAKRVIASGRCAGLKGKTPEATISAMLAVGSKAGGPFRRVDKGTYALSDAVASSVAPVAETAAQEPETRAKSATGKAASSSAAQQRPAAKTRPAKRSTVKRQTPKSQASKRPR